MNVYSYRMHIIKWVRSKILNPSISVIIPSTSDARSFFLMQRSHLRWIPLLSLYKTYSSWSQSPAPMFTPKEDSTGTRGFCKVWCDIGMEFQVERKKERENYDVTGFYFWSTFKDRPVVQLLGVHYFLSYSCTWQDYPKYKH